MCVCVDRYVDGVCVCMDRCVLFFFKRVCLRLGLFWFRVGEEDEVFNWEDDGDFGRSVFVFVWIDFFLCCFFNGFFFCGLN